MLDHFWLCSCNYAHKFLSQVAWLVVTGHLSLLDCPQHWATRLVEVFERPVDDVSSLCPWVERLVLAGTKRPSPWTLPLQKQIKWSPPSRLSTGCRRLLSPGSCAPPALLHGCCWLAVPELLRRQQKGTCSAGRTKLTPPAEAGN